MRSTNLLTSYVKAVTLKFETCRSSAGRQLVSVNKLCNPVSDICRTARQTPIILQRLLLHRVSDIHVRTSTVSTKRDSELTTLEFRWLLKTHLFAGDLGAELVTVDFRELDKCTYLPL